MNEQIKLLAEQAREKKFVYRAREGESHYIYVLNEEKFAELIVRECVNCEELLGAIARGWCSEKNSHKTMDSDLAVAIFDEVEKHIKEHFGVEE